MPAIQPVVITTLAAAVLFAAFHVPLPHRREGRWIMADLARRPARIMGIGYHMLMLPAVATLPAPAWAVAAGFVWMLIDVVLDSADLAGTPVDVGPFREGTHVVACIWLIGAGWTNGPVLAVIGTAFAAVFLYRLALRSAATPFPAWVRLCSTIFNIAWMVAVAARLA